MPPLAAATQPRDTSNLIPITPTALVAPPPTNASADPEFSPLALAPIPLILGTSTDAARQFYRSAVSQIRMPPLPAAASPATGAQAQTIATQVATEIVNEAISGLPAPSTSSVGDGVIHGSLPWEIDPSMVVWRDDFQWGAFGTSPGTWSDSVASSSFISELLWSSGSPSAAGFTHYEGAFPNVGMLAMQNNTTANSYCWGSLLCVRQNGETWNILPLLDYPSWKMTWVFGFVPYFQSGGVPTQNGFGTNLPNYTVDQTSMYVGMTVGYAGGFEIGVTSIRPTIFIGVRYDTDPTAPAISDTNFVFEVVSNPNGTSISGRNNTQGTTQDTGVKPTMNQFYRLDITCIEVGKVNMSLNGGTVYTFTVPTITVPAATGGSVSLLNGFLECTFAAAAVANETPVFALNSHVTMNNLPGSIGTGLDSHLLGEGLTSLVFFTGQPDAGPFTANLMTATGYPGLTPYFAFGNDSQATPSANKTFLMDFFGFLWNPGINGIGSTQPDASKSRYF